MIWIIILVAACVGLHHIVKYLVPVLRVTSSQERWDKFNRGGDL